MRIELSWVQADGDMSVVQAMEEAFIKDRSDEDGFVKHAKYEVEIYQPTVEHPVLRTIRHDVYDEDEHHGRGAEAVFAVVNRLEALGFKKSALDGDEFDLQFDCIPDCQDLMGQYVINTQLMNDGAED